MASFGTFGRNWSATRRHCMLAASASFCANAVAHPMAAGWHGDPGGDEGGDHPTAALAGVRHRIAHEVHTAALPGCGEDLRDGGLEPSCASEITSSAPRRPRRARWRRNSVQKFSASEAPIVMPSTSRRPSVLTPTAMITATETPGPPRRLAALGWDDPAVLADLHVGGVDPNVRPVALDRTV